MSASQQTVKQREPTYAIVDLFPAQGEWTEEEYLALDTSRIVELSDGRLEVAEMPTDFHQLIVVRLIAALYPFVVAHQLGHIRVAPLRVRLWPGKFREPDLVFMAAAHADRLGERYWGIPDLVAEVISPDNADLDRVVKKGEYARAGIPEYWLVDTEQKTVEVYLLAREDYVLSQKLEESDTLTSAQLPGFQLSLADLFAEE